MTELNTVHNINDRSGLFPIVENDFDFLLRLSPKNKTKSESKDVIFC